tara:strand:+ start:1801 stop:2163 length:363 start_codon:yes stop_codon:yes gene_type:complete
MSNFKMKGSQFYGSRCMCNSDSPLKETIGDKAKKTDWDSGSTRKTGDDATFGTQAYNKKGQKTNFESFENTSTVRKTSTGRPYVMKQKDGRTENEGEKVYLSSANEKGQPMSLASDQFKK